MKRIQKTGGFLFRRGTTWRQRASLLLQLLKIAVASGLSFAVANYLIVGHNAYFAPIATILIMQGPVAESLSRAFERILGVVAGVVVALLLAHLGGINALNMCLLIFVSMAIGHRLNLGNTGIPQVAISALMIMIIGPLEPSYWWERIFETAIGAAVGAAVYALIWPPTYLPQAQAAAQRFAVRLSELTNAFAGYFAEPGGSRVETRALLVRARKTNKAARDAQSAILKGWDGMRWNIRRNRQRNPLRYWVGAVEMLERVSVSARAIARLLDERVARASASAGLLGNGEMRRELRQLFALCGEYLNAAAVEDAVARETALDGFKPRLERALERTRQIDAELLRRSEGAREEEEFLAAHAVFASLQILIQDLVNHHARSKYPEALS